MWIQSAFRPVKRVLPRAFSNLVRSTATAVFAPLFHYYQAGHFRSAFAMRAVDRHGHPLPWYTYPCIEFLKRRSFSGRSVLEFGAGQSTFWWASVADSVLSFETDATWFHEILFSAPSNVALHHVPILHPKDYFSGARELESRVRELLTTLNVPRYFDVIVIDGEYRDEMIPIAVSVLAPGGAIICDNSDSYKCFFERFRGSGFQRVDFYGAAPGVILPQCTSIFFTKSCFLFSSDTPL